MKLTYIIIVGLSIAAFIACQSGEGSLKQQIQKLENAVAESSDVNTAIDLISKYHTFIDQNPEETEQNVKFLEKSADLYLQMNKPLQAVHELETALRMRPETDIHPEITLKLARIYSEKLRDNMISNAVYIAYLEAYPNHEKADSVKNAVGKIADLDVQMNGVRNNMYNSETQRINRKMANNFIKLAEVRALFFPEQEASIDALHKAGETARTIQNYRKAVKLYDWILEEYPDHPRTSQALFLKGFTYDNNLKNTEEARKIYEKFLEKYPNDDFADDTEFLLSNLGKSDEEIIKNFEK